MCFTELSTAGVVGWIAGFPNAHLPSALSTQVVTAGEVPRGSANVYAAMGKACPAGIRARGLFKRSSYLWILLEDMADLLAYPATSCAVGGCKITPVSLEQPITFKNRAMTDPADQKSGRLKHIPGMPARELS
jgi:hypothetical protein